jgi:hypothetical protein
MLAFASNATGRNAFVIADFLQGIEILTAIGQQFLRGIERYP